MPLSRRLKECLYSCYCLYIIDFRYYKIGAESLRAVVVIEANSSYDIIVAGQSPGS